MINSFKGEYRWLSNFWPVAIPYEGILYTSVENAYQAAKTLDQVDREKISLLTAGKAKRYGKKLKIRDDWDSVKLSVMTELVTIKFTTDPDLKKLLMDTHPQPLVEGNTWGDVFWGVCKGQGENNLGKILMAIREDLCKPCEELDICKMPPISLISYPKRKN